MPLALIVWFLVFAAAGLRSEALNSDTESYVDYARLAAETPFSDYLSSVRLEPGWSATVHVLASSLPGSRGVLLACAAATMLLLLLSLRVTGGLVPLGMLHYLAEFYLNNELAVIRHSFATAMSLAIVVGLQRQLRVGSLWRRRFLRIALAIPPLFHLATIGVLAACIGAKGSPLRIFLNALAASVLVWLVLRTLGGAFLPERVLEFDPENTREIRGYIHLVLLAFIVIVDARSVRSAVANNPYVAICYLCGIGLSLAVVGFPLLARIRHVLLEFGILFYPLVLAEVSRAHRLSVIFFAYAAFIVGIGAYTVYLLTEKYSAGFF